MKATYKYKRDQYKAERDDAQARVARLERELAAKPKVPKPPKERWRANVYCTNCQEAYEIIVYQPTKIDATDCAICRVVGDLHIVAKCKLGYIG